MNESSRKKMSDEELLGALEAMETLEETLEMTGEEIEAHTCARGGDPEAVGRRGVELVKRLVGDQDSTIKRKRS